MERESQYAGQGMGRQMGIDGSWSKLEAWLDNTRLWRPDCYLANWHHVELTFGRFWAFLGVEKRADAGWEVDCTFALCFEMLINLQDLHILD